MRKPVLTMPVLVALLAVSATGVMAQDDAGSAGLGTEEVEPGVERIVTDGAGHDLDVTHPTFRYDMDAIAIAPDGTVWLWSTYSRSDNAAHPEADGQFVWALGRPGMVTLRHGVPPASPSTYLYVAPDGTQTLATIEVVATEDGAFIPSPEWTDPRYAVGIARSDGQHSCWSNVTKEDDTKGVTCVDPAGMMTDYLSDTRINQMAVAPDGTLWAVGGYAGDNGGLYRITID